MSVALLHEHGDATPRGDGTNPHPHGTYGAFTAAQHTPIGGQLGAGRHAGGPSGTSGAHSTGGSHTGKR